MGISFRSKGNFNDTEKYIKRATEIDYTSLLHKYGQFGVEALAAATPVRTGRLASSWRYEIEKNADSVSLVFHNDDIEGGRNIAILINYGYATKSGYFVQGRDFIDPAIKPILDDLAENCWKEVTNAGAQQLKVGFLRCVLIIKNLRQTHNRH